MPAMAAAPPAAPRLDSVLSFGDAPVPDAALATLALSDDGSDAGADFEFAFAPALSSPREGVAPADDLFAHGRLVPAYPVFDRHLLLAPDHEASAPGSPDHRHRQPSPDTYCAWAPRSAPGSPSRDALPKSKSTGEARRFWRLRDLVAGGGGRSHSDGREKFVFLQSSNPDAPSKPSGDTKHAKAPAPPQKQGKTKKKKGGAVAEMDMATAHRLFYSKPGALAGDRPRQQQRSYLPYRPGIVGFFTAAHALGRSHHPY